MISGFAPKELHPCHPERSEGSGYGGEYLYTTNPHIQRQAPLLREGGKGSPRRVLPEGDRLLNNLAIWLDAVISPRLEFKAYSSFAWQIKTCLERIEAVVVKTYKLADDLEVIDVAPPIPGFEKFIGVYVLEAGKIALVDPGPSVTVTNLFSGLKELGISPADVSYIFATHIHIDHAGGIGKVVKQMPRATVVVHEKGRSHLIEPSRLWQDSLRALGQQALAYQPMESVPEDRVIAAKEGTLFDLGGTKIEVVDTPGHASHHLGFLDRRAERLFSGDAAGVYIEELDLARPDTSHPFNLEQALKSIDKLISLAPSNLCYAHFGCTTHVLEKLNQCKQELVLWAGIVADCLDRGASYQDMYDEISRQDTMLARIGSLPPDQRNRELFYFNNSIDGLAGYFKRYGTRYIRDYVDGSNVAPLQSKQK